jgi:hypothetical protein
VLPCLPATTISIFMIYSLLFKFIEPIPSPSFRRGPTHAA